MPKPDVGASPEFRIFETQEFLKRLDRLPEFDRKAIARKLRDYVYPQLKGDPFFGPNIRKLRGYSPGTWRYRIGRYRLFYAIDTEEHTGYVLTVDLRRDADRP